MRIAHILPGSGGTFYCQNCLRDTALVQALRRQGQDVVLVPMYLPIYTDGPELEQDTPVFFGGINVYLQQKSAVFRNTPRWLDRLLDARWLLRMAARHEGSTRASGLGEMTLSMLRGEEGRQVKELDRLVEWLASDEQPDLVHLSSIMLLGLARRIKQALDVPVMCTMQDEDTWIDKVESAYAEACWDAMRERAAECDGFVTVSRHYRDAMCPRLGIDPEAVEVVPIGINMTGYQPSAHDGPPTLGYLSRLTPSLGLGTLVEAFMILKRKEGLSDLQLRAMGGVTGPDKRFVARLRRRLARAGMAQDVRFVEELDRAARIRFVKELSVLSVPLHAGEAFGTFMVEAWAAGVPVVQPRAGAFPELVAMTGGGVVYDGETAQDLVNALEPLLRDRERTRELGQRAREVALHEFNIETMAERMVAVYENVAARRHEA